jgi:outer membrane immunogenic protein
MKKAILATVSILALSAASAYAADLPRQYKAPPAIETFSWAGFYVGGHLGWGSADKDWAQISPAAFALNRASFDASGFLGGGQVGFNLQSGAFVYGVEFDASWTNADGDAIQTVTPTWRSLTELNWLGTVTGRIGYAWDRVLLYAKGGVAWANETHSQFFTPAATGISTLVSSLDHTQTGWVVGGGIEWAMSGNWSAKVEYNYVDLGSDRFTFLNNPPAPGARATDIWDIDQRIHMVKFGINYRFGGPVVARY